MKKFVKYLTTFIFLISSGLAASPSIPPSAPTRNIPSTYLGQVATRSILPVSTSGSGTGTWTMSRSVHYARDTIVNPLVSYANFYSTNQNVETGIGDASERVSLEYPTGTITPCQWQGNTNFGSTSLVTVSTLSFGWWSCPVIIPNGAKFFMRDLYVNPNGILYVGVAANYFNQNLETFLYGIGIPTDYTQGGTMTPTTNISNLRLPAAIVAPTRNVSVCIVGDSRALGIKDTVTDPSSDVGEIARSLGPVYGYINLGVASTTAASVPSNFTQRINLIKYCSHVVDEYGVNDSGSTASTIASRRSAIAALWPNTPTWGTTIYTETTSTDSWVTTTNQTVFANNTNVVNFNTLVRAGISGEAGLFDSQFGLDPLNVNKFPVSYLLGSTSGVAFTPDGNHLNSNGTTMIKQSNVINPLFLSR